MNGETLIHYDKAQVWKWSWILHVLYLYNTCDISFHKYWTDT